ncbi:MAG: hypothetical protein Kow0063_04590 [Anaerolineae bacterium]
MTGILVAGLVTPMPEEVALARQATDVVRRTPTVTVTPGTLPAVEAWHGRIVSTTPFVTPGNGSILRVHVLGRVGEPIVLTRLDTTLSGYSGTKSEYGPYAAEFAPVPAGRWTLSLPDLNASLEIEADGYNLIVVQFEPVSGLAQPVVTPTPVPSVPPTSPTPRPSPTPTPSMEWVAAVLRHDRPSAGKVFASIAVRVNGLRDTPVRLTAGDTTLTCITGTKPEYGDYACEFGALSAATYSITVEGLAPVVPIMIGRGDFVLIEFREEPVPAGQIVWMGRVVRNSSQPQPGNGVSSAIAVRVEGRRGQVVSLRSSGGWVAFCETGTKPEYGDYACEFGGLWPGVYTVSPVNIPVEVRLYVDGVGFAEIAFESVLVSDTPTPTPTRLIGAGASPVGTPVGTPVARGGATVTRTPDRLPTRVVRPATPTLSVATPTFTPSPAPTPTPAVGWVGRIVQNTSGVGVGAIVVRVLDVRDQPVILRSGPWAVRGLTGSKPEYGEHAVEFGGLNQGDFSLELEGLGATLPVHLEPGGFVLVEFRYDLLPTPTATPQPGVWVGAVTSNTSGGGWAGAWSTLIVKIPGLDGLPVTLDSGGGFVTTCITGTKPEHGPGACEIGGLWPATYRVTPQGLGPSVDVWLDGAGSATVEFWIQ